MLLSLFKKYNYSRKCFNAYLFTDKSFLAFRYAYLNSKYLKFFAVTLETITVKKT